MILKRLPYDQKGDLEVSEAKHPDRCGESVTRFLLKERFKDLRTLMKVL